MQIRLFRTAIACTLFFMHLCCIPAWGREGAESANVFGFAESLYEEADYFRAISEYKRYQFLYPAGDFAETVAFRIAESYFKAKRWPEAIAACNLFISKYRDSLRYYEMLYLKGRVEKLDKKNDESLHTFDLIINAQDPTYSDKAIYQKALVMLERVDWRGTRNYLLQVPKESPLNLTATAFLSELDKVDKLPHKSPRTAGILAAVLPGAGHLYTERPQDALAAFLLNGSFIWGAVELFRHDNYAAGGILTFFELGWYGGNIYSAVSGAHKYNQQIQDEFIRNIKDKFYLSFYRDSEVRAVLLTKRF
ncbi:MAG: outer membrane protein assembly factor BamD [Syntrophales bacterium]|nr:outer membrane protein assembly factor BamD [Syntrophales bacterium]